MADGGMAALDRDLVHVCVTSGQSRGTNLAEAFGEDVEIVTKRGSLLFEG